MPSTAPEIDAYIAKSPEYARPILDKLRALFHEACPEIEESIKWGFPHFEYKGIVGSMAAFKQHVGFDFWKGRIMRDPHGLLTDVGKSAMSAIKAKSVTDLPDDAILLDYIREAVELNEKGVKVPRAKPAAERKPLEVPSDLAAALSEHPAARTAFDGFSYSHRKEYIEWITEAKREATRQKRIATTIEWLAEGKPRNWKYM